MTDFTPKTTNYAEAVTAVFNAIPLHQTLGIQLTEIRPGYVCASMDKAEALTQQNGYLHAGALISLADAVGGSAAATLIEEGQNILSVNFAVSMLRPADSAKVRGEGRVVKAGKRFIFSEARIYGDSGGKEQLLVSASITLAVV